MSYTDPEQDPQAEYEDQGEDADFSGMSAEDLKQLRGAANRTKKADREAQDAKRELAFLKAGVDTESKVGALFASAYQGELETDVVKQAWAEVSGDTPPEPPPDTASSDERSDLATGATGDTGQVPKAPVRGKEGSAVKNAEKVMEAGGSRQEAQAAFISEIAEAAMDGDGTVIVEGLVENQ